MKQERECHDIKTLESTNGTRTTATVNLISQVDSDEISLFVKDVSTQSVGGTLAQSLDSVRRGKMFRENNELCIRKNTRFKAILQGISADETLQVQR